METYIKLYDWMSELPLEERVIYALIYQLTQTGNGYWSTIRVMADRLRIPKSNCKAHLKHLEEIGAIELTRQTISRKERRIYFATSDFADKLKDD